MSGPPRPWSSQISVRGCPSAGVTQQSDLGLTSRSLTGVLRRPPGQAALLSGQSRGSRCPQAAAPAFVNVDFAGTENGLSVLTHGRGHGNSWRRRTVDIFSKATKISVTCGTLWFSSCRGFRSTCASGPRVGDPGLLPLDVPWEPDMPSPLLPFLLILCRIM